MYLLRILDLLALCGLFVQTFLAWVFVAVLASIRDRDSEKGAIRTFLWAFVALSLALTVMSVRFFRAHDVSSSYFLWADGRWAPLVCYSVYMGLKAWFVWLLVLGSHQLSGRPVPRGLRPALVPLVLSMAAAPILLPGINDLLVLQAPIIVVGALLSLHALRDARARVRLVRGALIGLAITWSIHATAVLVGSNWESNPVLSLNSFIDLGVQLLLGVGLVVCLLEDSHRRRIEAEQEREGLRQSLERDEKLRALGTVVSGVAHELNNPLTVILGHADILRRQAAGHRPATIIKDQAERCRGIVRNLSALAGQSVHPREEVDLEALVRRVVSGLPERATREGRHVVQRVASDLRGSVDRVGIEQVLANLIGNGLQAGPPGSVVTVRGARSGDRIELTVTDEGPGVPAELRERIFEPFFTTKAPGRGTGLGLSIARAIVRGHGGSLSIEDAPSGHGSTFRVRLPCVAATGPEARGRRSATPSPGSRLLVIDDDVAVRTVIREEAELRGWTVREAESAEQALAESLSDADAVLCDLRMPGIGGIGLHDRLAADRPDLLSRVVFFTGDLASPETVGFSTRCERPLVEKPFDFDELFARLGDLSSPDSDGRSERVDRLASGR